MKAGVGRAQRALTQNGALGLDEAELGVVADRADIAEVIGQPF